MSDRTAQERFEDMLDSLDAAVEDLAFEADIAPSSSAKVKAISARVRVLKERQQMLDEAGLLTDGIGSTTNDNTLYMTQGIFVP